MTPFRTTVSGLRTWHTSRPSQVGAPVLPMSREDIKDWQRMDERPEYRKWKGRG